MRQLEIVRIDLTIKKAWKMTDFVAEEKPMVISINGAYYATIFSTPSDLKELAVGHLLTEGIIKSTEEVEQVDLNGETCDVIMRKNIDLHKRLKHAFLYQRVILSACGSAVPYRFVGKMPKVKSNLTVKAEDIWKSVHQLNFVSETFRKTGGVHVAAICSGNGSISGVSEDVGRHNAVDKVIGKAALANTVFPEYFLSLSGRLTGDIIFKAARVNIPIVASLAGAIDSGIQIASDTGLTAVGFVRGKRMNIYTFPGRIVP